MSYLQIFKLAIMSFNAIRKNKILAKFSKFTVYGVRSLLLVNKSKGADQPAHLQSDQRLFICLWKVLYLN